MWEVPAGGDGTSQELSQSWVIFPNHSVRAGERILGIETCSIHKVQVYPRLAISEFAQFLLKLGNIFFILHWLQRRQALKDFQYM